MNTEQSKPITARQAAKERGDTFYKASHACAKHGGYERYVSNGMCPKCQRECKAKSRVERDEQDPSAYYAGRNARAKNRQKVPPAIYEVVDRYWWLAGFNDRDLELRR